ncbi:MAG: DNA-directed RNA polymerase subunit alpha [Candidatus Anoxychlamydiales bacterium]|nr:DNA-directed RNA polymerase subunit alpha [Candidatus Anoxychlamydiales bacterium]NGX35327.1 DNA-directed RNA polymerase subunit alpha [Candidatus Anoxychlamydiales bacterium]
MSVMYGTFELPDKITKEEDEKNPNFAKFVAEPFERGYGHTLGNALRRIMLTSIEAPAIVSIRIERVSHEYTAIEGVIEDMTHIILNLKGALLRYIPLEGEENPKGIKMITKVLEITDSDIEKANGNYNVTLKDIMGESNFEVVNPDLHIFTATKPTTRRIDIKVGIGRGYIPADRHDFERQTDEIVIDSAFSPVTLVNYYVENTRVGQHTDFDRLILEVTSDGRITPEEALTFATQIGVSHFHIFDKLKAQKIVFEEKVIEENKDRDDLMAKLSLKINEIELSVRSTNCLSSAQIETIGELVVMPESDMLRFRNFGKKSLTEIKEKLSDMSLSLGMDLTKYGINKDNIKSKIEKHLEERKDTEQ